MNDDLISRKMAIDAIIDHIKEKFAQRDTPLNYISGLYKAEDIIEILPSAQPVDKDINVPTNDTISRQAAIEALKRAEALTRAFGYHNVIETIREVPSAQHTCGTCYYWGNRIVMRDGSLGDCGNFGISLSKDFFCAWWSQKEKGDEQDE